MPARRQPRPAGPDATPVDAGLGTDPSAHHHGLFRSAAGVHYRHCQRPAADPRRARRHPPLHLHAAAGRAPVEPVDALPAAGRGRHPHRRVRPLQCRPAQACLPSGPGAALWQDHAVHRRDPLQLLAGRRHLALAAGRRRRPPFAAGLPVLALHRADPQLPPLQLAADVPVRRLAGTGQGLPARPPAPARAARRRYPLPALRHQPADERPGLPEQCPGRPDALLRRPRQLHREPARRGVHALPALRGAGYQGRRGQLAAAQHQRAADRERVLLEHPPQARHRHRRAPAAGAARTRHPVHRSALPGHQPFLPLGIDLAEARFLDAFLLFCALDESPCLAPANAARPPTTSCAWSTRAGVRV